MTLVAPWEEYVIDLSPDFQLKSGEDALKRAIPTTATIEEKILNTFGAFAKVQVDVATLTAPRASMGDNDGAADDSDEGIRAGNKSAQANKRATHNASPGTSSGGIAARAGEGSLPTHSPAKKPGEGIGMDPMLEYAAATAFFQEVKLLNRYVADAALRRGYRAYVVRLQMNVVPYVRHAPLDIYTNISFFPRRENVHGRQPTGSAKSYTAEVIPLLVTDNLKNTIKSRSLDSIRNFCAGLELSASRTWRRGKSCEQAPRPRPRARDLNGLLTVGRVSDNTLQLRLGAVKDIARPFEYAMLPRTHNVTILLMVPADFVKDEWDTVPRITAVSKTQLREAMTGKLLPAQAEAGRRKLVEELVSTEIHGSDASRIAEDLLHSVFRNNFAQFEEILSRARPADQSKIYTDPLDLWCRIVETFEKSDFAAVRFELPPAAKLPKDLSVLAVDDGAYTTIDLQGGSGLNQNGVSATLFVTMEAGELPLVPISEPPGNEVKIMAGGHGMTITFPSLAAWNIVKAPSGNGGGGSLKAAQPLRLTGAKLCLRYAEGRKWTPDEDERKKNEHICENIFYVKVKPTIGPSGGHEPTPGLTTRRTTQARTARAAAKQRDQ